MRCLPGGPRPSTPDSENHTKRASCEFPSTQASPKSRHPSLLAGSRGWRIRARTEDPCVQHCGRGMQIHQARFAKGQFNSAICPKRCAQRCSSVLLCFAIFSIVVNRSEVHPRSTLPQPKRIGSHAGAWKRRAATSLCLLPSHLRSRALARGTVASEALRKSQSLDRIAKRPEVPGGARATSSSFAILEQRARA